MRGSGTAQARGIPQAGGARQAGRARQAVTDRAAAVGHGAVFFALMLAGLVLLALIVGLAVPAPLLVGYGFSQSQGAALAGALPVLAASVCCTLPLLLAIRRLTSLTRRLVSRWCGVPIAGPYPPRPQDLRGRIPWLLGDRATWRDLLWVTVNACGGWIPAMLPAGLLGVGVFGVIAPYGSGLVRLLLVAVGLAGLWGAPAMLRGYGVLASLLLAPSGQVQLVMQVKHLTETRTEALGTGAAEIRRIERDLHDGAQARLVAMGMTLDAAGQVIDSNPDAARALLYEARDASVKALAELRALVRGIHPPVLADRGLADAIRALALDSPLRVTVASDLNGRLPAPVESAAYFTVSELLANVSKHAQARHTWIDIRHTDGMLRIGVTDNGQGGADPALRNGGEAGGGLRGIERRLAAFDGVLAVSSPPGGPTSVTLEIPCALSSPKTSSC